MKRIIESFLSTGYANIIVVSLSCSEVKAVKQCEGKKNESRCASINRDVKAQDREKVRKSLRAAMGVVTNSVKALPLRFSGSPQVMIITFLS